MNEVVKKSISGIIGVGISTLLGLTSPQASAVSPIVAPALSEPVYWLITELETKSYSKRELKNLCAILSNVKVDEVKQITLINDDEWFA